MLYQSLTLRGRDQHPHFVREKTEVQRCPGEWWWESNSGPSDFKVYQVPENTKEQPTQTLSHCLTQGRCSLNVCRRGSERLGSERSSEGDSHR